MEELILKPIRRAKLYNCTTTVPDGNLAALSFLIVRG